MYRLSSSRTFVRTNGASFTWTGIAQTNNRWATNYTYDANGNIRTLQRYNEATTAALMDNLVYGYDETGGRLNKNRLYNVNDATGTSSSTVDDYRVNNTGYLTSNPTGTGHFGYDDSGNLIRDKGEAGELNMEWNVYGKVSKVTRTSGTKADLEFYYDAAGRRVMKIAKPHGGTKTQWKYTIFAYDAGGQVMAEYDIAYSGSTYTLGNTGNMLYGASKLGRIRRRVPVKTGVSASYTEVSACSACATAGLVAPVAPGTDTTSRYMGQKQYEFGNHLGNILVTLSDRKLCVDDGTYTYSSNTLTKQNSTPDGKLDYYLPDVLTANDYYPGGMPLPGRTFEGYTCSTYVQTTLNYIINEPFDSGTGGFSAMTSSSISNSSGRLLITATGSLTKGATRSFTPVPGIVHTLRFDFFNNCSATLTITVKNQNGIAIYSTTALASGAYSYDFTPATAGTYRIEFSINSGSTCNFQLDNVQLSYNTSTEVTDCSVSTIDLYAWGHNGQLKDNELYGNNMAYTAEYWEYDSRLLRRWNTDPIEYEWQSAYACFNNNPIYYADPLGLEGENDGDGDKNKDGKGNREEKQRADGGTTVRNGDMTWEYDKNNQGEGGIYTSDRPMGTIYAPPSEPQDAAESGSGIGGGWMGKAADIALNGSAIYQIANGNYGEAAWAMFPAASLIVDYWSAPYKIMDNLAKENYVEAGLIYGNQIMTGVTLMVGAKAPKLPKMKVDTKVMTQSIKKTFAQEIGQTSKILAGASDDVAKSGLNLTKSQSKAIASLRSRIAEHQSKLAEYIKDPMKFDNKGFLKNAPNDAIRQKIIQTRITHLQQEIKTFENNILKIINGQ